MARTVKLGCLLLGLAAVIWVGTAWARTITEFNYTFDTKDNTEDFEANEGSKIAWQEGGAADSKGCLKVTGEEFASIDTPVANFKVGDNSISFYYKSHGFKKLKIRLNTAPDDVAKYGKYGNFEVDTIAQDKWVQVIIKPADLKFDQAKGSPDLTLKSITIVGSQPDGATSYLLIDEVKFPGAKAAATTKEAGSKPAASSSAPAETKSAKVILDFENADEAKMVKAGDENVTFEIADANATSGKKSLKVTIAKPGEDWGPLDILPAALKDLPNYKFMLIDLTTDSDAAVPVSAEVQDEKSTNFQTRATQEEGITLKKGKNTMVIDLSQFTRNDRSGKMDLSKITKLRLIFTVKDLKQDYVVFVDNIRLTNEAPK